MSKPRLLEQKFLDYKTSVGFWLYLMTDCVLFASLFATYAVLRTATAGGPSGAELFELPLALTETLILLTSSFTCGLALLALRRNNVKWLVIWLAVTYVLGVSFLTIELTEFSTFMSEGNGWQQSAFLSAFFTLVGTHGLHIFIGLLWLVTMVVVLFKKGITPKLKRQLGLFGLFWHFLDLVWIFIFTVVYLMGAA
jgi:cytochrome o ubiquinol oxidase subunit 3